MTMTYQSLASGPGWRVTDIVCRSGPGDRPFEEQHDSVCIALVTGGSFQYRSTLASATIVPGSLLLGNQDACFECGHEHGIGDRCLAFNFSQEHLDTIFSAVLGARPSFNRVHLPPLPELMSLSAAAEAARDEGDMFALEEIAVRLAGAAAVILSKNPGTVVTLARRDEKRVTAAVRRIEAQPEAPWSINGLARDAAMSPYHFLRVFRRVIGMTPHQYVLRTRMHRAAIALRTTRERITDIAYAAGFNDLSTFNRRFHRLMGVSPGAFRRRA